MVIMCRRKNRIFRCMCVIMVLIVGMCFGDVRTDSFLSLKEKCNAVSYIDSYDEDAVVNGSCTLEMLGIKNHTTYVRNVGKKTNLHQDAKISLDFAEGRWNSSILSKVRRAVLSVQLSDLRSCVAIVTYIHKQDGKK